MSSNAPEAGTEAAAKLLLVGGGKMGEALAAGLLSQEWCRPEDLVIAEMSPERRAQLRSPDGLAGRYPRVRVVEDLQPAEGVVVAVKPSDVEAACRALVASPPPRARRLLSVAAGVSLAALEDWCGEGTAVIRAMPNTAALVGAAATAIAAGSRAGEADLDWAASVMGSVGAVVEVPEKQLDAVTGLSGSGPAYIFLVAEALTEGGVLAGLPRHLAARLTAQTLLGAARLLDETGEAPEALRAAVTSPGGTTAAGLRELETRAARSAFIEAVQAAAQRSRELGR